MSGVTAIGNLSLFVDVREWQTWGLETNTTVMDSGEWAIRALPQLHLQVTERFRLQLSVGAEIRREEVTPWVAVRTILE
ncbi:MAG: hypothetical protein H5U40_18360 [Polyangiaceae bacterium]|nr:hypothetical protein [Polyangiaceae bacterium]